jgi:hypothetical protein
VNYTKSSVALLNCDQDDATAVAASLGCPIVKLPMTYPGIHLTIRRPTSAQLQPIIEAMAAMLPAWKAGIMAKAGCLALVKSVLCAIPIHQLLVYAPKKKVLKQIENNERGFLWGARKEANGGSCHVNWRKACRPLSCGGFGVQDMERAHTGLSFPPSSLSPPPVCESSSASSSLSPPPLRWLGRPATMGARGSAPSVPF